MKHRLSSATFAVGRTEVAQQPSSRPSSRLRNRSQSMQNVEADADSGRAIIELIVLAVLVMIPVVYLLIAVLRVQAATFAASQAARDAATVLDNAPNTAAGLERAKTVALVALDDQNIPSDGMRIRFVAPGADCIVAPERAPDLQAGSIYDVCVISVVSLPGVPTIMTGSNNTITGVYTLHVGEFREGTR